MIVDSPVPTRRVFLHVGSPKTGTTFLQNVLWSQRERAAEQGLLLPMERFFDHFLASLDVRDLAGRPEHPARAVGSWDRLVAESRRWKGHVLVSHELLAGATAEQAQRAVHAFGADCEVHVIITARDLVRQIPAEWQEHVKHRATKTFAEFVDQLRRDTAQQTWFWRVQDFADVAARWGSAVPPSRVHVVTVPPEGADPRGLWVRFAALLGLDPDSFETELPRVNTSLGAEQTELLRRINSQLGDRLPIPGPYARVVKNGFAHRVLEKRAGSRIALPPADRDFAVERSADIAKRLASMDVDVVGSLDELVPPRSASEAAGPLPGADTPAEALLEESIAALADLLVVVGNRRAEARYEQLVRDFKRAPIRFALLRASERRPVLRKARRLYQRRHALARRLGRRPGESPDKGSEQTS